MVERVVTGEVEVDRFAMPETQRESRASVQDELAGDHGELGPQHTLCRREDVETRDKSH